MGFAATYVKASCAIFGVYGVMMLLNPGGMVTDHWDIASTPEMEFWIRGHAVTIFCEVFLMMNVETAVAAKAALAASVGIGILYPWNARFGYLTPNLPLSTRCTTSRSALCSRSRLRGPSPSRRRRRRSAAERDGVASFKRRRLLYYAVAIFVKAL